MNTQSFLHLVYLVNKTKKNPQTNKKVWGFFMRKIFKRFVAGVLCVVCVFCLFGCKQDAADIELPQNISLTEEDHQPLLKVYDITTKTIVSMDLEEYIKGVLAGEMFNDWPIEALKAQAILARTYTLRFLQNSTSKYEGADISNDVTEAQAYDASKINENIERAVNETRGKVVICDDQLIEAWFHSNSGGVTTTAKTGLGYLGEENYTAVKESPENIENSENFKWNVTISKSDILSALREMGVKVSTLSAFEIAQTDDSGRAVTFKIGDAEFSANTFRLKVGSTKMKSTFIDDVVVSKSSVAFSGKGYGHGVGMSQWGAKVLAEEGRTYEDIIMHYFDNVEITRAKYE